MKKTGLTVNTLCMYCISRAVTSKPLYYRINLTLAYLIFHGKERHDIRNFFPVVAHVFIL